MNPSLAEYHVPVHLDVPDIDVMWTDEPDPHAPVGARGVGEIGITGVGAAVANAVFNALLIMTASFVVLESKHGGLVNISHHSHFAPFFSFQHDTTSCPSKSRDCTNTVKQS